MREARGKPGAEDLTGYLRRAHHALRTARAGVLGAGAIDPERAELTCAGAGDAPVLVVREERGPAG